MNRKGGGEIGEGAREEQDRQREGEVGTAEESDDRGRKAAEQSADWGRGSTGAYHTGCGCFDTAALIADQAGGHDGRQCCDAAHGEVDATGEDDESHAYGEHGEGGHLVRDLLKGRGAEEMASGESEEEDDRSQHADQPERFAEAEAGWAGFVRHGLNRNGWNQGNCALVMRSTGVFLSAGAASPWRMERATSIP